MNIGVMGTLYECKQAQEFYKLLGRQSIVRSCTVSEPYLVRPCSVYYRIYIEIEYRDGVNICSVFGDDMANERAKLADTTTYPACADDIGR